MSDSFASPRTIVTKLPCPWDFPGKNIRVGRHFLGRLLTTEPPGKQSTDIYYNPSILFSLRNEYAKTNDYLQVPMVNCFVMPETIRLERKDH